MKSDVNVVCSGSVMFSSGAFAIATGDATSSGAGVALTPDAVTHAS